ncbi:nucleoporin Nup43-like [Lineus longissimus]|uniref:nucleoporin Nup43-like n=1 Tax=Lineus longissimus TaxID=88925 RepID=UPI002B4DAF09
MNVKFVSQKISKIRWKPVLEQGLHTSDTFATGSWDCEPASNHVSIWVLDTEDKRIDAHGDGVPDNDPRLVCNALHDGDVMDLQYMTQDVLVSAGSTGNVTVYKHNSNTHTLATQQTWQRAHHHISGYAPATSVATRDSDLVVSGGEDGRINVLKVGQKQPERIIDKADSSTINALTFLKHFEVIAINSIGQLKVWDLRTDGNEPARIFKLTGDKMIPLHCVDKHPTQPHIVATGGQDGNLCTWDMRQEKCPVTLMEGHSSDMWEVRFHRSNPNHLFTCSEDGTVWHWDCSGVTSSMPITTGVGLGGTVPHSAPRPAVSAGNPWTTNESTKHRMEINDILPGDNNMPINTLDINGNTLICGSDNEAIFIIPGLALR